MKKFFERMKLIILIVFVVVGVGYGCEQYQDYQAKKLAEESIIKVACVGDSNTYHYGGNEVKELNYSYYLTSLLGDEYKVKNYGMPGNCVQSDLESPYTETRVYKASVELEADKIIIMLGTNDIWNVGWRDEETFYQHYIALIDSYLVTENKPEIYLCTIPAVFVEDNEFFGYELQEKVTKVNEIIRRISNERGYDIIDIYTCTSKNKDWYDDDGIHLNAVAAREIAEIMYWSLTKE